MSEPNAQDQPLRGPLRSKLDEWKMALEAIETIMDLVWIPWDVGSTPFPTPVERLQMLIDRIETEGSSIEKEPG
jgi:hypothetical protein